MQSSPSTRSCSALSIFLADARSPMCTTCSPKYHVLAYCTGICATEAAGKSRWITAQIPVDVTKSCVVAAPGRASFRNEAKRFPYEWNPISGRWQPRLSVCTGTRTLRQCSLIVTPLLSELHIVCQCRVSRRPVSSLDHIRYLFP